MKIHSICLAKNEADIIKDTLESALQWSDTIYFIDNGSSDGTWELARDLAKSNHHLILCDREFSGFKNWYRARPYHEFAGVDTEGDWWCRLDADEIYIDNPRQFLANVPAEFEQVWSASFLFFFTDEDYLRWQKEPDIYEKPGVLKALNYYLNNWSELRFFRQRKDTIWPVQKGWPVLLGSIYPKRIRLRHYKFRSPKQIDEGLKNRNQAASRGDGFKHQLRENWKEKALGKFAIEDVKLPNLEGVGFADRMVAAANLIDQRVDDSFQITESLLAPLPAPLTRSRRAMLALKRKAMKWKIRMSRTKY